MHDAQLFSTLSGLALPPTSISAKITNRAYRNSFVSTLLYQLESLSQLNMTDPIWSDF